MKKEAIEIKPIKVFGKTFNRVMFSPANITLDDSDKKVRLQAIIYDNNDAVPNMPVQNLPSVKLPVELDFVNADYAEICQAALVKLELKLP